VRMGISKETLLSSLGLSRATISRKECGMRATCSLPFPVAGTPFRPA